MASVEFEGHSYAVGEGESVLDALLRNGRAVPYSCKAGSCGCCMMRAVKGSVPEPAQAGLKDSWKAQGYFLPCVCRLESDLVAAPVGADAQTPGRITGLALLNADVLRVRLAVDDTFEYRAGQYISLLRDDGLARSYSIASLPEERELELHVRRLPNGRMSGWLHERARVGDPVRIQGPSGDCFYVPGREDQPLLLVGTGTGLAPLYGIVRDAIAHGHRGPMHLFHGAVRGSGLYLRDELQALAAQHAQLEYTPTVLQASDTENLPVGSIDQIVLARLPKLNGWRGYACGDPALVQSLRKKLFLSGMASRDIHADPFLPAAP